MYSPRDIRQRTGRGGKARGGADATLQQDKETAAALRIKFEDMVQEMRRRKRGNLRRTIKINT